MIPTYHHGGRRLLTLVVTGGWCHNIIQVIERLFAAAGAITVCCGQGPQYLKCYRTRRIVLFCLHQMLLVIGNISLYCPNYCDLTYIWNCDNIQQFF